MQTFYKAHNRGAKRDWVNEANYGTKMGEAKTKARRQILDAEDDGVDALQILHDPSATRHQDPYGIRRGTLYRESSLEEYSIVVL